MHSYSDINVIIITTKITYLPKYTITIIILQGTLNTTCSSGCLQ